MSPRRPVVLSCLILLLVAPALADGPPVAGESARQIPVAYQVDVVVVGGSTGAVSAAVAAAKAGAKVFLAAPYPYLGDDMTATLRLWLEEGEVPTAPLARRIFTDPVQARSFPDPNRIPFVYEADLPSAGVHKDANPPAMLTDGVWGRANDQSVQYDGDVNVTADLGKSQAVEKVRVVLYHRASGRGGTNFKVESVTVFTSDDKESWKQVALLKNKLVGDGDDIVPDQCFSLSAPVVAKARYVKLLFKKTADVDRILLGEVELIGPSKTQDTDPTGIPPARPMHVKKTLDDALLEAGVEFLYSCYPTDVLRDTKGNACGIVMANRAGRQAVVAKTIIDATDRAVVARLAGAESRPYPGGMHTFKRVVIGGEVQQAKGVSARTIAPPFHGPFPNAAKTSGGVFPIIEYTLQLPVNDASWASLAAADQQARAVTYHPEQQFTSDRLFEIPPDPIDGRQSATGPWQGMDKLPLGAFRPKDLSRLFVLSGCADVSREQAEKLLRPLALIDTGTRIGVAAAAEAKSLPMPAGVKLSGKPAVDAAAPGDVREMLTGVRPTQKLSTVPQESRALPVLGRYDVVVIGGGTAGAPAGIAAARRGAKTLVVEYLYGLGGVGTLGAISKYCAGNRVGFTATIPGERGWVIEQKMEWFRSELRKAGADIWFGSIGCGALVDRGRVTGAVVATPYGRGVVLAKVVIDATGNADVAAPAGAECIYTNETELAMQGTGLPPRELGATYTNTDFTITDETDMVDIWHLFVYAKHKYPEAFDQGQLIDTRERRCIVGDFTMTILDQINRRTYPDTIAQARGGGYDTHGYTVDPFLMVTHPKTSGLIINTPYRCLLPKGLEGILVAGLGASAHRDAVPLIRMQPDIQNQGYAAGAAAALAVNDGVDLRKIDIRKLQKHLVEIGSLSESVLTDEESGPPTDEQMAAAVESVKKNGKGAAVILTAPDRALPLLREAYKNAEGNDKLTYAYVLAVMGDATGMDTLLAKVQRTPKWDEGWNYRAMGQFGMATSPLDNLIMALGRTRDSRAVPAILKKLKMLSAESDFSHHRAVGLALERIGDPAAARPLAELLSLPGMSGYVHKSVEIARQLGAPGGTCAVETRRESIRELALARALYRCGDYQGLGKKTLTEYTKDLRGHVARHAQAVLKAGSK